MKKGQAHWGREALPFPIMAHVLILKVIAGHCLLAEQAGDFPSS